MTTTESDTTPNDTWTAEMAQLRTRFKAVREPILAALNLLQVIYDEPRRGTLLELLSLPCMKLDWVEEGLPSRPARWEALSKEFGLVKGWEEFRNVLALQLATVEAGDPDERQEPGCGEGGWHAERCRHEPRHEWTSGEREVDEG